MTDDTFAAELRRLREARRLSQAKLAELAGCDHAYISRLEGGTRHPTRDMVTTLAGALGLNRHRAQALHLAAFVPEATILAEVLTQRALYSTLGDAGLSEWTVDLMAELAEIGTAARDRHADAYRYGLVRLAALALQAIEAVDAMDADEQEAA